jgi:hypothetical protein
VVPAAPELEALLAAAEASEGVVSLEQLQTLFSFRLDDFQAQAVQVLLQGRSVVVCAPTGERPMTGVGSREDLLFVCEAQQEGSKLQ